MMMTMMMMNEKKMMIMRHEYTGLSGEISRWGKEKGKDMEG
jgi:hypothetical protein